VCGTPLWVLAPHPPHAICRSYLDNADLAVRIAVFRILGVFHNVQTLDKLNCPKRELSLPAEFGGLNLPSLELDAELDHYASFAATLANVINDYESESLGHMYGRIRQDELFYVVTSTKSWAV
jgi:hypothetical protein